MTTPKIAIDPLWQCLCPAWTSTTVPRSARVLRAPKRPTPQCLHNSPQPARRGIHRDRIRENWDLVFNPLQRKSPSIRAKNLGPAPKPKTEVQKVNLAEEPTTSLYHFLRTAALEARPARCREIAEVLVRDRGEKPSLQIYNALILSHVSHDEGTVFRVMDSLEHLKEDGFEPDTGTCHAVLKVLSVHSDHLLRTDILHYMAKRWYTLSDDGAHDVAAGLLREGLFEQALQRLDMMRRSEIPVQGWLLDMAVYALSEANEIPEAYRILRQRLDSGETNLSRSLYQFFLECASSARHHAGTSLVWTTQVQQSYINPSSGTCLNVLSTASRSGDAVMATEVFTHLSKRGTAFKPIHYSLLINAYLTMTPPDLKRALSILTIMPLEKLEPSVAETRSLYTHMRDTPHLVAEAQATLRDLHAQNRKIPIAALNLLIECYVHQGNLPAAMNVYKQIHTFVPLGEGAKKSFANIETFNHLLKGCRSGEGGIADAGQASFLVSELLALRIKPTALTYDRLILVFIRASNDNLTRSPASPSSTEPDEQPYPYLDWAYRHFTDMQPLGWLPRVGTMVELALALARAGDARCWDVLQAAEDRGPETEGWGVRGQWARSKVEAAWAESEGRKRGEGERDGGLEREGAAAAGGATSSA